MTCVLMLAAAAARATTIVMPSDDQLIAKSPVILIGTVTATAPVERDGKIWTESSIDVAQVLKGNAEDSIVVREIGGQLGERFTRVFGTPELAKDERVMLFLERSPSGGYRTIDLFIGKFSEGKTLDGRRLWLRHDLAAEVVLLDKDFQPLRARNVQRDAAAFETFVADRAAGRAGVRNYGIENPIVAGSIDTTPVDGLQENFTMLDEPTIYRWGSFDAGVTARWYHAGTQAGYSGGGVNELQTAMAAWTGYSAARILYSYNGAHTGAIGGHASRNNVNEVVFGDPTNEISGTFSGSGVVGTGGFNGVNSSGTWNAPFTADATHTAGAKSVWNISEANLVIQDGVSPSTGISSNRLAEIVAHEFGHTLGFGHSPDSSALMYASVTGLGPSLKADDQLAARWLYPSGTTPVPTPTPTPSAPAAPSNLAGTPVGSSLQLQWRDNANNETGQSIYVAAGSGAFTRVGDVAVNATSATLNGFATGTYRVYVAAFNTSGESSPSNTITVTFSGPSLNADFTVSPATGTAGVTSFTFTDTTTGGTVTSRQWSFGDGGTATAAVVSRVYTTAGSYTVTLTVSGNNGTSQISKTVTVTSNVVANFNWSPANPTTNDNVTFFDQTTGGVSSWSWSFGDGTYSSDQNPQKRFAAPGVYNVTLTAFRTGATSTATRQIVVAAPAPIVPPVTAAFDASSTSVQTGTNIQFADRSTGSPTSWQWTFGDGGTSTAQHPVHSYAAAGTYTVSLRVANAVSQSTATKTITVTSLAKYRSLISAAAQTNGLGGTSWRTELSLFNAGTQGATVTLLFIPGAGGTMITRTIFLSPRQSSTYANALLDLFGLGSGAGALAIEASSAGADADLRVTSRTFTSGDTGTYGQSVPDVSDAALEQTLYLTAMQANASYRTNLGLVNRGNTPVSVSLRLYNADGETISDASVSLPANNFQQSSLQSYFPEIEGKSYDALSLRLTAAAQNAVTAYASIIDNKSQDPVYVQAMPQRGATSITLPVVGRSAGLNGTFWRSDMTIFNPGGNRVLYSFHYRGTTKTLSLGNRSTFTLRDVVTEMGFGNSSGTFTITWNGNNTPIVTSRTYTTDGKGGTFGQSIDPIDAFATQMFVTGLRSDAFYRSNVGFVNGGTESEQLAVTLLAPGGYELGSTVVGLGAGEVLQQSVSTLFPGVSASAGSFTLSVRGDANAKIFAFGSMIDNASGDPVFFGGR